MIFGGMIVCCAGGRVGGGWSIRCIGENDERSGLKVVWNR